MPLREAEVNYYQSSEKKNAVWSLAEVRSVEVWGRAFQWEDRILEKYFFNTNRKIKALR